jgi:P4 family phage/plasmid primase-like protien
MSESSDEQLSELGRAALDYIARGWGIVPLRVKAKEPATKHGLSDWTDNPETARKWWSRHPNSNIGIVCGSSSRGLLVIDVDVDEEKDKDGYASLSEFERLYGELPETVTAITGSGGIHYLYRVPMEREIRPTTNATLGIDVRCERSYIVAPPSIHPNGNRYEWQDAPEDIEVAEANNIVYQLVDYVTRNGGTDTITKKSNGKFKLPERIEKGNRNDVLYRYACHLQAIGRPDAEIEAAVAGANALRCEPPLRKDPVRKLVKSALRHEKGEEGPKVGKPGGSKGSDAKGQKRASSSFRSDKGKFLHHNVANYLIDTMRACNLGGVPAVWTGKRWDLGPAAINRAVIHLVPDCTMANRKEVFSYLQSVAVAVSSDTFDPTPYVQFQNATFDPIKWEVVEPTPEMYITNTLPIPLDIDAESKFLTKFIASLANHDTAVVDLLYEVLATCLASQQTANQSPLLMGRAGGAGGNASNGKSTFIKLCRVTAGEENCSSLSLAYLGKKFQAHQIIGKLANLGDDIAGGYLSSEELETFKKIVTGDSLYTDVKNTDGVNFTPTTTLVFSMNELPRFQDNTEGVMRRLAPVPFKRTFRPTDADYDPNIATKLSSISVRQAAAVAAMAHMAKVMETRTYSSTPEMLEEVEMIRTDNNSVLRWIDDEGVTGEELLGKETKGVYMRYKRWAEDSNEHFVKNQRTVTRELTTFFGIHKIKFTNTRKQTVNVFSDTPEKVDMMDKETRENPPAWVEGFE